MRKTILTTALALAACVSVSLRAGTFTNSFNDPNQTAGFTLNPGGVYPAIVTDPVSQNGYLALTTAVPSENGTIVLDPLDPVGTVVGSFTAKFKVRMGGGTSTPADGMMFYFGNGLAANPIFTEEGPPAPDTGIGLEMDTFDNGGGEAPAIDVIVNGVEIAHTPVDIFFITGDVFVPVTVQLNANGTLNATFNNRVLYTNLVLTGYAPITNGQFGVSGRTGDSTENNWLDDLGITTVAAGAPTAPTIITGPADQKNVPEYGTATFSVLPNGTPPFTFQWYRNNVAVADATNAILTLTNVLFTANSNQFHLAVTNSLGGILSTNAILTVIQDVTAPTITGATGSDTFNTATLTFSEAINIASATFTIDNGLAVSSATLVSSNTVVLNTSLQTTGRLYTVTVNGVTDLAGFPNPLAANSTIKFTGFVWSPGFLKFEYWANIPNAPGSVADLTSDPRYIANTPDAVYYMTAFNSRTVFPNDTHEQYGDRETGFIVPTETADYYFFLVSDDASELWLSMDANPANETQIATAAAATTEGVFFEPGSAQTGGPFTLTAGQRYAVMALHKEGTGGDFCQVAWRKTTDTTPAANLKPIDGGYIGIYANPDPATLSIGTQPANATTSENKAATFTVAVTGSPAPIVYQWQREAPGSTTFTNIPGARAASYTTPLLKRATDDGAKYQVLVAVLGKSLVSAVATLSVGVDTTPPQLTQVYPGINLKSATVFFSEDVAPVTAGNFHNYTVPGLTVTAAKVINPNEVRITTSQQTEKTAYTVTVSNVTDLATIPNVIDPSANSLVFTSMASIPVGAKWEAYTAIGSGAAVSDLTGSAKYPFSPDDVHLVPWAEGPINYADAYGSRLSGFITPKTTDNYVFFIATDDNGELWLSTDDTPDNLKLIAQETANSTSRQWVTSAGSSDITAKRSDQFTGNQWPGGTITLTVGQRYYFEVLQKDGGGDDHSAIAWKLASAADPADGDPPIQSDVLSTAIPVDNLTQVSLPLAVVSPIGSGDASKPGFRARVWQSNQDAGATDLSSMNNVARAEQQLAGAVPSEVSAGAVNHANAADLTGAVGGIFASSGYINWNIDMSPIGGQVEIGDFTSASTPSRPDVPVPGIPGIGNNAAQNQNNFSVELVTYVEFPSPGIYFMGVNSDDGFKVTATDQPPAHNQAVVIHAPSSVAGQYYAVDSSTGNGGICKPLTAPIVGKLVAVNPYDSCSPLINTSDLAGNVAIITRGVCTYTGKIQQALDAGAIGVIMVNSRDIDSTDGMWPVVMGGSYVDVPGVMIAKPDGVRIKAALDAGENITVDITPDTSPAVGIFNAGRGSSDTLFAFNVQQAGVYPMRCVYFQGNGGGNIEWFTVDATGKAVLLNDIAAGGLKAYQARTFVQPPSLTIGRSGANVVLTFDGTLKASGTANGVYTNVPSATSPYTNAPSGTLFFRAVR
jgi:hypothetical protein